MQKTFLLFGALLAGLGVAFGAFGAHGLKKIVTPENVATFQTGVQYQIYHALALLLLGVLADRIFNSFLTSSGFLFLGGILFFPVRFTLSRPCRLWINWFQRHYASLRL